MRVSKCLTHGGQRILCWWTEFPKANEGHAAHARILVLQSPGKRRQSGRFLGSNTCQGRGHIGAHELVSILERGQERGERGPGIGA